MTRRRSLTSLILASALLLTACAQHLNLPEDRQSSVPRTGFEVTRDLTISPEDWPQTLYADLYEPQNSDAHRPAVLMVHGGGWEGRSRGDMNRMSRALARAGFVVLNVDYRFAPEYPFPHALHDVQIAMHWLHDQASDLHIDPDRIGAAGFSSGAHLVSLMAMVAGQDGPLDAPYGGERTRPYALVAGGTPSDLQKFADGRLVEQFLGGTRAEVPEQYALASPVEHVHPDAPPVFLFHGTWDRLVPPDHATDFLAQLEEQGVQAELFKQRLRGHATSLFLAGDATRAAIRFLSSVSAPGSPDPDPDRPQ